MANALNLQHISSRVDARTNLPSGARWSAESECGPAVCRGNQAGQRQPSRSFVEGFLLNDIAIAPDLRAAYLETLYGVEATPRFALRIGQASEGLLALYRKHHVNCAAYITAFNPYSRAVGIDENTERQAKLEMQLRQRSLPFLEGQGRHPSNTWPAEDSFLVLGLALAAAKVLGQQCEQNAIVWCGADAVPQLITLRD